MAFVKREITAVDAPKPKPTDKETRDNYFVDESQRVEMYSSGCQLLDCVLGGGWPVGRMSNIVGDKSTGKTGMVIEACANFNNKFIQTGRKGKIWYFEAESAFDKKYAEILGLPLSAIDFVSENLMDEDYAAANLPKKSPADMTVETVFENLENIIARHGEDYEYGLYIVDSLDALSDRTEQGREIDAGSFGTKKAAKMSELFRRLVCKLERAKIHLLIISQVRDNIGVTFGAKHTRSGGKAMDFYASQVLWLAEKAKLKKTMNKIERVVGIEVMANCKKNKIGMPYRTCQYPIMFGFGIDDIKAHLTWLEELKLLDRLEESQKTLEGIYKNVMARSDEELLAFKEKLNKVIIEEWYLIEQGFLPERSKY